MYSIHGLRDKITEFYILLMAQKHIQEFPAHMSAESSSNISPNPSEVSEP
jgi:hypothetical protein